MDVLPTGNGYSNLEPDATPEFSQSVWIDGPWPEKREKIGKSLLALNREIAGKQSWAEEEIESRAANLAAVANRIWTRT